MPVVAFRIRGEPVYTYSLLLALGLLLAVLALALEGRRRGWRDAQVLEVLAWALVPAVLGGRLAYVLALGFDGGPHLRSLVHPWGEGLLFPGALLGGALGLGTLAAWRRRRYVELLGAVAPGLALGQALGWLGAAVHGTAAGVPWRAVRWAPQLRDLHGIVLPRFPLQYLAAGLGLVTFALLAWERQGRDARRVACYALLTGWGLLGLSWGLERRVPVLAGLSAEQAGYLALGLAGLGVVARLQRVGLAARPAGKTVVRPKT